MSKRMLVAMLVILGLGACDRPAPPAAANPLHLAWPDIEKQAHGQQVTLQMWQGDPQINAYLHDYVVPALRKDQGIDLRLVPGQGDAIVTTLMAEAEAGRATSQIDLVWINGETFYQLRQIRALLGPYTDRLPNNQYLNWDSPFIANDFQQPVAGYECPWGNVQLLLIADRARVGEPPRDARALAAWIHAHPGRFTFDTGFTGMSFLKSLLYAMADSPGQLQGNFDEASYVLLRERVFAWLRLVRKDLWHQGDTFPSSVAQLNGLFGNGEVDFTMSFNDGQVDNKIASGLFPASSEAYALTSGTLRNTHYLGIAARSGHVAGALVVANFLISPEAQFEKLKPAVWGDGTVLDVARLPAPWPERFAHVPGRLHAPARAAIEPYALREPAPETMIRITSDFRRQILDHAGP
jgi:putative spermidine/putrescine transport system substrate-binding protein